MIGSDEVLSATIAQPAVNKRDALLGAISCRESKHAICSDCCCCCCCVWCLWRERPLSSYQVAYHWSRAIGSVRSQDCCRVFTPFN